MTTAEFYTNVYSSYNQVAILLQHWASTQNQDALNLAERLLSEVKRYGRAMYNQRKTLCLDDHLLVEATGMVFDQLNTADELRGDLQDGSHDEDLQDLLSDISADLLRMADFLVTEAEGRSIDIVDMPDAPPPMGCSC